MGQTGYKLKTRINESENDIDKKSDNLSVISEHRLEFDHKFDWNKNFINKRDILVKDWCQRCSILKCKRMN